MDAQHTVPSFRNGSRGPALRRVGGRRAVVVVGLAMMLPVCANLSGCGSKGTEQKTVQQYHQAVQKHNQYIQHLKNGGKKVLGDVCNQFESVAGPAMDAISKGQGNAVGNFGLMVNAAQKADQQLSQAGLLDSPVGKSIDAIDKFGQKAAEPQNRRFNPSALNTLMQGVYASCTSYVS